MLAIELYSRLLCVWEGLSCRDNLIRIAYVTIGWFRRVLQMLDLAHLSRYPVTSVINLPFDGTDVRPTVSDT